MRWTEAGLAMALAGLGGAFGQVSRRAAPQAAQPSESMAPATQSQAETHFVVVLDASHGGSDTGARLGNGNLEKNLTLTMAERLQDLLRQQGVVATMTRRADVDMSALTRAEVANHAQAAVCLVIHATATGSGVHLFTTSLAPAGGSGTAQPGTAAGPRILPWATAQAAYVTDSLKLESELDAALVHAEIPVTMGRASVAPMDNFACPTVAVELAPLAPGNTTKGRAITDERYEESVESALAAGIGSWRTDRKEQ
jgi:N-acetylmuramoyl-L-alanine amidase